MKYTQLGTLEPGTKVTTEGGVVAIVLYVNPSRVRVRIGEARRKEITRKAKGIGPGLEKTYSVTVPAVETDWGFNTMVKVLESVEVVVENRSETLQVKRGRPPTDPVKRREWDAANDRARMARDRGEM